MRTKYNYDELSAADLAHLTGTSIQTAYNKFFRGTTQPTLKDIVAIATSLEDSYDNVIVDIIECLAERRK